MPAISFSGRVRRGFFYELILKREKTQTCRPRRKRPIKVGDHLRLYWKQRVAKHKKPIHKIGDAVCVKVENQLYQDFADDCEFARREGFINEHELQEWFGDLQQNWNHEYDVIHWQLLPRQLAVMIFQATDILRYWEQFDLLKRSRNYAFWEGYLKGLQDVQNEVFRDKREDVMEWALKQMVKHSRDV